MFFRNASGLKLAAWLDMPSIGIPRVWALFAHAFTHTKQLKAYTHIRRAMTDRALPRRTLQSSAYHTSFSRPRI
ncbi:MAG: hypothetical protein R8K53_08010 [Mariprofundaceae bacterium]